jgi:hypothetical protein
MNDMDNTGKKRLSNEDYERTFDPMFDLSERWDISMEDAESFLESIGYFQEKETER